MEKEKKSEDTMRCQSSSTADCIDKQLDWQIFADRNATLLVLPALILVHTECVEGEEKINEEKLKVSKSPQTLL